MEIMTMNPPSATSAPTQHPRLLAWVKEISQLCQPDSIYWCDGSEDEKKRLTHESLASGELEELNPEKLPGCYYSRSNVNDVARTEDLTFICTRRQADAGPTNN